jgi:hypothetical protein
METIPATSRVFQHIKGAMPHRNSEGFGGWLQGPCTRRRMARRRERRSKKREHQVKK